MDLRSSTSEAWSQPLLLERYYARWEFDVRHNLSASDPEPIGLEELLALAGPEERALWDRLVLRYVEPDGLPELRETIAARYADLTAEDVTVTVGAQEAIYLAMRALVGPGDHVVAVAPAFQVLHEAPRACGAEVSLVPLTVDEGWTLDVDGIIAAFRPETRILVLNFPHNPTGSLPSKADFRRLVTTASERGVRCVSDEVFRGLEFDPSQQLPAAADLNRHAVSVGDMSKGYGLPGIRVGWIACRDRTLLEGVAVGRDFTTICGSGPSQVLALIGLRASTALQERARSIVSANLKLATSLFSRFQGRVEWIPPSAGTTAFPRLVEGDVDMFCERLAKDHGVLLAPGSLFETEGGHFRLGLGHRDLEEGLQPIALALAGL